MTALAFVENLLETGRVRAPAAPDPPEGLDRAVCELDRNARLGLALEPPILVQPVGEWALLLLFRACQSLVYREIEADAVIDALSRPCPAELSPQVCYSADLAFQFLPDLIKLARGIAQDDPLVTGMLALAEKFPLSSVGVTGVESVNIDAFIIHPSLRRLYADRIIDRDDSSRLDHPAAREAVREALGAFPELAPKLAAAIGPEK